MSDKFKIAETNSFIKKISHNKYKKLYSKIESYVYPILRNNPYYGPNVKRLKGEYSDLFRFRIGDYRLFYSIDNDKVLIFIIYILHRKDAYK